MKKEQITERLDEIFSNVENGKNQDEVCFLLDRLVKDIEKTKLPENESPTNGHQPIEMKDSIKITKNTKGYNYEFRIISKENVDLLSQVDYVRQQLEERTKRWSMEK